MKKRVLTFVLSASVALTGIPNLVFGETREQAIRVQTLSTIEEAVQAFNQEQPDTKSILGKSVAVKKTPETRVVINSKKMPEEVYGAKKAYYYQNGGCYVLEYSSVAKAKAAEKKLEKQYDAQEVFQDHEISLGHTTESSDADESDSQTAFDGIHAMGLDTLKEQAKDWKNEVKVAVIDTGIDLDHPWFTGRIDENSINMATDKLSNDYDDETGHGTHVSGVIAKGTGSQVKIMAVRVFDKNERASVLTLRLGVDYAVSRGADVLNLSLGYNTKELAENLDSDDLAFIDDSFEIATDHGCTVCVASGNEYTDVANSYPACSGWTIAVGSIEKSKKNAEDYVRSDFSNDGVLLDFTAPGGNILSAWNDGKTKVESGTSMASPHLAAAAAMIKLKHPEYTQWDVYATMRDYAVDLGEKGKDKEYGYGYVNLSNYASDDKNTRKKYQGIYLDSSFTASIYDKGKEFPIEAEITKGNGTLSYRTTDRNVADVKDGKIIICGGGTCEIEVIASGTDQYLETKKSMEVTVSRGQQTISVLQSLYTRYESDEPFYLKAMVDKPGDGTLSFLTNANDVAEVTEDGKVTIHGTGTIQVYPVASRTASYERCVGEAITIEVKKDSERPTETTTQTETTRQPETSAEPVTTAKQEENSTTVSKEPVTQNQEQKKKALPVCQWKKIKKEKSKYRLYWKKQSKITGYQLRYATNKKMKKAKVKQIKAKNVYTLQVNKNKKTTYVQIRVYQKEGKKIRYGTWSTKKKLNW